MKNLSQAKPAADLLMLPGWAIAPSHYQPLLDALKTKVRGTIFDYGFFSSLVDEPMRMPSLSKDCAPLIIVAHSMGSLFAFRLASMNPAVKAIVLFGGFARFSAGNSIPGRSIEDLDSMKRHLTSNSEVLLKSFYRASSLPEPHKLPIPPALNKRALADGLDLLSSDDASDVIAHVKIPCLDIISSGDMIVDAPMSTALASLMPAMEVKQFYDAGHLLPLTRVAAAAKSIDDFIASHFPEGLG